MTAATAVPPALPDDIAPDRARRWTIAIVALALLVRVVIAIGLQLYLDRVAHRQFLIEGDANGYWELAHKLARGEEFSIYTPPRSVLRMPGFPALLAVSIRLFGDSLFAARLGLACVATLVVWLTIRLGASLYDRRTGLIAGAFAALSPAMAGFGVDFLSETAFAACMVGNLWAMAVYLRRSQQESWSLPRHAAWGIGIGVLVALACYMRPSWLLAGPIFAGAIVLLRRPVAKSLVTGAMVLAGCFLALHPWAARNQRITGHYIPTTLWMGPSLYDGLNPKATGDSEMSFFDQENLMSRMTEYEVDRHYRAESWKFVRENPRGTLELAIAKFGRYWKPWPNAAQFERWPLRLVVAAWFLPVMLLAGIGLWRMRRDYWGWLVAAGPIVYFCGLHLVFVSSLRYRLPAEYPLLILSAVGLQILWPRRGEPSSPRSGS